MDLECSCPREQLTVNLLSPLHHCEVVRRWTWQFNLLDTLCTSSYLDVRKTCSVVLCVGEINLEVLAPVTQLPFSSAALQTLLQTQADQ